VAIKIIIIVVISILYFAKKSYQSDMTIDNYEPSTSQGRARRTVHGYKRAVRITVAELPLQLQNETLHIL